MKGFLIILFYLLSSPSQALEARVTKKKIRRVRRTLRQANKKHTRILNRILSASTKSPEKESTKAPSSTKAPAPSTKSPTGSTGGFVPLPELGPEESTKAPTPSSTKAPTPSNTKAPSSSNEPPADSCDLEGHLAFEYDSPYEAPYYGVHEKYLTVYRNDLNNPCSGTYQPSWCVYENTEEGYYTSYLEILPSATEDEAIMTSESITSLDAFDTVHFFCATHIFQNLDLNATNDDWRDHLMAPTLTLKKNEEKIGKEYKNVVDIPTHVGDEINPEFPDEYCVEVKCNGSCDCSVSPFLIQMD